MTRYKIPIDALDPNDETGTWQVGVTHQRFERLKSSGHDKDYARLFLLLNVLTKPTAVYRGWNRDGQEDGLVYVGKPESDYHRVRGGAIEIEVPAPAGMLFIVFVTQGGTVDSWSWRKHTDSNSDRPQDLQGDPIWEQPNRN